MLCPVTRARRVLGRHFCLRADNLSSGTIFSVADITGLPTIEVDADGKLKLCEYGSGIIAYNGITLDSGVPTSTTDKLYSDGYKLNYNGAVIPKSDPVTVGGVPSSGVHNMMIIGELEYAYLSPNYDPNTIYFIV